MITRAGDRLVGDGPRASGCSSGTAAVLLTIDVAAVTEADDDDLDLAIANLSNDAVVADAVLPELAEFVAFQCGTQGARGGRGCRRLMRGIPSLTMRATPSGESS